MKNKFLFIFFISFKIAVNAQNHNYVDAEFTGPYGNDYILILNLNSLGYGSYYMKAKESFIQTDTSIYRTAQGEFGRITFKYSNSEKIKFKNQDTIIFEDNIILKRVISDNEYKRITVTEFIYNIASDKITSEKIFTTNFVERNNNRLNNINLINYLNILDFVIPEILPQMNKTLICCDNCNQPMSMPARFREYKKNAHGDYLSISSCSSFGLDGELVAFRNGMSNFEYDDLNLLKEMIFFSQDGSEKYVYKIKWD